MPCCTDTGNHDWSASWGPVLARINRAIDTAERSIQEPIGVGRMADAAAYSLFHFIRTFNRCTLYSPYEYLIRRRVRRAIEEMQDQGITATEAAFRYCFESSDGFSRAVKRCTGYLPSRYREIFPDLLPGRWDETQLLMYIGVCSVGPAVLASVPDASTGARSALHRLIREIAGQTRTCMRVAPAPDLAETIDAWISTWSRAGDKPGRAGLIALAQSAGYVGSIPPPDPYRR